MKKSLHIVLVNNIKIPPIKYGGTERVVYWLGKALVKLGHKVSFIVPKGSVCDFADIIINTNKDSKIANLIPESADIVHAFAGVNEEIKKPLIVTIGGNGKPNEEFHKNTVFVSKDHAQRHGTDVFVHNGIDPDDYPTFARGDKKDFCYFLAKARWKVKNVDGAIKIAKKAGLPIKIMGGWKLSLNKDVKWMGMLGGKEKNEVLKQGSALLFPVRWHEPFGIAIIEALYTGSPVFGTEYGSLPELVPLEYGFLSNKIEELVEALVGYKHFDPIKCREYVLNNFTHMHMAAKYLDYYQQILSGKTLSAKNPRTLALVHPETLLDFD